VLTAAALALTSGATGTSLLRHSMGGGGRPVAEHGEGVGGIDEEIGDEARRRDGRGRH
jgi:hypothetical protein